MFLLVGSRGFKYAGSLLLLNACSATLADEAWNRWSERDTMKNISRTSDRVQEVVAREDFQV